jgi:cytochrome c biogenesis protein CcmG, thiol:disulfide interchange protein DsbE
MRKLILLFMLFAVQSVYSQSMEIPNSKLFTKGGGELILHEYLESLTETDIAVLNFTSVSCIPCKKEIPELLRLSEKHPNIKLFIIFAEADPSTFANSLGLSKYYADPLGTLQNKYKIKAYPVTYLVFRDKKVLSRLEGYTEKNSKKLSSFFAREEK